MTTARFVELFYEFYWVYLPIYAIMLALYRLIFIRKVKSIIDPIFFFIIFTNSICSANVIFLSLIQEISVSHTVVYLTSEIALLAGIIIAASKTPSFTSLGPNPNFLGRLDVGMVLTLFIAVVSAGIVYTSRGVPLLLESRSEASSGGTGFGLVTRVSQAATLLFVIMFFIKLRLANFKSSIFEKFMFLTTIIIGLLSGYKSFFLLYFFCFFIINGDRKFKLSNKMYFYIFLSVIVVIFLFYLTSGAVSISELFTNIFARILASGDVYYMSFGNNQIYQMPTTNFSHQMFGSLLASFRLIEWSQAPENYGYVINKLVNGNDLLLGPTFRYNVLFMLITDNLFFITLMSFCVGLFVGVSNRILYNKKILDFKFVILLVVYFKSFILILGPDHGVADLFLSMTICLIIIGMILILSRDRTAPV